MATYLSHSLGSYSDCEEFQVGKTLVWVKIPSHDDRAACLLRADILFEQVWQGVQEALSFATDESRGMVPEFWSA